MFLYKNKQQAFSFIELIIVIAIIGIFAVVGSGSWGEYNKRKALETDVQSILATLEEARSNTLQSVDSSKHGVHFEASRFVLFKGASYNSSDPENEIHDLQKTSLSPIALSGGESNVIFERLSGKTNQPGTITVSVIGNPAASKVITIYGTGIVEFR